MSELYLELPCVLLPEDKLSVCETVHGLEFTTRDSTGTGSSSSVVLTEASVNTLVLQLHAWLLRDKD